MKLLWLTWKDHRHPAAGGAEIVARELTKRLLHDGHHVAMLTCGYGDSPQSENLGGVEVTRIGTSRYLHPFQALAHYARHMRNRYDILIEEVNAAPYFSVLLERRARSYLFYHQMEQPVWQFETKAPLCHLGRYVLEPVASRLLSLSKTPVITVSASTASDLARFGFQAQRTHIISEGIELQPLSQLEGAAKYTQPTVLSLGAMRPMKRTLDQIRAFEFAKTTIPTLQLKVAGNADGSYGREVLTAIAVSPYRNDIHYLGRVSQEQKVQLMQQSHLILQTAIHEGWGLTITEAASQGTPAVAYDVNGLRDSVRHQETGIITAPRPDALARGITHMIHQRKLYDRLRHAAWQWSKTMTFDRSYRDFKQAIGV